MSAIIVPESQTPIGPRVRRLLREIPHAELEAAGREQVPDSLLQRIRDRSASRIQ